MEEIIDKVAVYSLKLETLEELKDLAEHQQISVRGKVCSVCFTTGARLTQDYRKAIEVQ